MFRPPRTPDMTPKGGADHRLRTADIDHFLSGSLFVGLGQHNAPKPVNTALRVGRSKRPQYRTHGVRRTLRFVRFRVTVQPTAGRSPVSIERVNETGFSDRGSSSNAVFRMRCYAPCLNATVPLSFVRSRGCFVNKTKSVFRNNGGRPTNARCANVRLSSDADGRRPFGIRYSRTTNETRICGSSTDLVTTVFRVGQSRS